MASPTHSAVLHRRSYARRTRRSTFNGARQLNAAQASNRRTLALIGLLVVALLAAVGTIGFHLVDK